MAVVNLVGADPVAVVRRMHERLERTGVSLPVRLWDGTELGPGVAGYRLVLRHPWSLRSMLLPANDLSVGEAYLLDDIDVEGSMISGLTQLADLRVRGHVDRRDTAWLAGAMLTLPRPPRREIPRGVRLTGPSHTRKRDRRAVRFHYDVDTEFYRLYLDRNLVYSCAYFSDDDPPAPAADPSALDRAQVRKLDLICRKLRLRPGRRLLDIGCGWGALVIHAARHYGARAIGITLSEQQAETARERIARHGLADRVTILVQDYRDATGTFDAVASIGMFEHVGRQRFGTYFAKAYDLTAVGGLFLNHAITTGRRMTVRDLGAERGSFVGKYVFPDGTLAPAHTAVRHMEETGFELLDVHQLRRHYAGTLRHWVANLERRAAAARAAAGDVIYRTWRAYMSGSVVGFERNDLGVIQVLGAKGHARVPLSRGWMEPTARRSEPGKAATPARLERADGRHG